MKTVAIGYSKWKTGRALASCGCMFLFPFLLYVLAPGIFNTADKSATDSLLIFGTLSFISVFCGLVPIFLLARKYQVAAEAVLIYRDGVWSNVSGLSEKFFAWDEIESAHTERNQKGLTMLCVKLRQKKSPDELEPKNNSFLSWPFEHQARMQILPLLLNKSADDIANIINGYVEDYRASDVKATITEQPMEENNNRRAA